MTSLLQNLADAMSDVPPVRTVRCDGWVADKQAVFLRALACGGDVTAACAEAGLSVASAYALRTRRHGAVFALGWHAAVLVARARLADELLARALHGQTETLVRDGDEARRHRHDNRLAMAMLTRLDRKAEGDAADGALARLVAQDFDAFVELIERGAAATEAALFLSALHAENPLFSVANGYPQLKDDDADEMEAEDVAEVEERRHDVWFDDSDRDWMTNFPPPPDFDGLEEGAFGDPDYRRSLSDAEEKAHLARRMAEIAPVREAGEAARDAFFGFVPRPPKRVRARKPLRAIEVKSLPQVEYQREPIKHCEKDKRFSAPSTESPPPPPRVARPQPVSHVLGGPVPQWLIDYNRRW